MPCGDAEGDLLSGVEWAHMSGKFQANGGEKVDKQGRGFVYKRTVKWWWGPYTIRARMFAEKKNSRRCACFEYCCSTIGRGRVAFVVSKCVRCLRGQEYREICSGFGMGTGRAEHSICMHINVSASPPLSRRGSRGAANAKTEKAPIQDAWKLPLLTMTAPALCCIWKGWKVQCLVIYPIMSKREGDDNDVIWDLLLYL